MCSSIVEELFDHCVHFLGKVLNIQECYVGKKLSDMLLLRIVGEINENSVVTPISFHARCHP
jgi:hypothetical protein